MRIVTISLAVLVLVLAGLAAVPADLFGAAAALAPRLLSLAAALAALALAGVSLLRPRPTVPVVVAAAPAPAPVAASLTPPPAPAAPAPRAEAEIVALLGLLQDKGRLIDFLMDDVTGYDDAQVGAAARVLHQGCKAALAEHFGIVAVVDQAEGSRVTVPAAHAPDEFRLVGRIGGQPPFTGVLVHHGWKVEWVKLPRLVAGDPDRLPTLAPAEIELG
ncbi:MAG: hypothetical protein RLZZ501_1069 [Pseudomonadota bacterium]|jgi:hypothetical protein